MWVGDWTELLRIDPHSSGHSNISLPFSWAAHSGAWRPSLCWVMVLIPASSLQLIWTSCHRGYIIIWHPPTSCERHNSGSIQPFDSQGCPLISSTGCTCYLHKCISYFYSSAGANMLHFLLRSFKLAYSSCKFMIHFNNNPYKHKSWPASTTKTYFSKIVFFSLRLSFNAPLSTHPSMRYFWGVGNFTCRYWRLYFSKSICSPYCQRTNPIHLSRPKKPGEISYKLNLPPKKNRYLQTSGTDVVYLFT